VIYFYWKGLWGSTAGPEGAAPAKPGFRKACTSSAFP